MAMQKTAHYQLPITDDTSTRVKDWREAINSTAETSAFQILDKVLNQKADRCKTVTGTLSADGWSADAPYTQTLSVAGLGSATDGIAGLASTATSGARDSARRARLAVSAQSSGQLTIVCDGSKPAVDIPVAVTMFY